MSIKIGEIAEYLESISPSYLAEDYDNVGLLIGSRESAVKRVMFCLDVSSKVVDEAVNKKVDLIISHHPMIFKGIKRINEDDPKGRNIYKLIRNNIAVYSAHTNLDSAEGGLNDYLGQLLGLCEIENLKSHRSEKLYKLVVYVPEESVDIVRNSISRAGAGWIGNYSDCSFMTKGTGTFKPLEGTNPYSGVVGSLSMVDEYRLETVVPEKNLKRVIAEMKESHPYEEVAYDVYLLNMPYKEYGFGKVGHLKTPLKLDEFIKVVKEKLEVSNVRVIGTTSDSIRRVAVFSGSFDESLISLAKAKADILVTGDIKYHTAFDFVEMGMCVIDAGHYGTEKIVVSLLSGIISNRFPELETVSNTVETDPFKTN